MAVEVGNDQIGGGERGVVDAAGLDDDERLGAGAVDAAGVAEGVGSEAAAGNFAVGVRELGTGIRDQRSEIRDQRTASRE